MPGKESFLQAARIHIASFKKQIPALGSSELKKAVKAAEDSAQGNFSLDTISEPFISVCNKRLRMYLSVCLDYFASVFFNSTLDFFPDENLTARILSASLVFNPNTDDTCRIKICSVINYLMRSPVGSMLIHGTRISRTIQFLIRLYDHSLDTSPAEVAEMTLHETIRTLISGFVTPDVVPNLPDLESLADWASSTIVANAIEMHSISNGCRNLRECDISCLITEVCRRIQDQSMKDRTLSLCVQILNAILKTKFEFYETPVFFELLRSEVHYSVIAAAFGVHKDLSLATSNLMLTLWRRFPNNYMVGLGEVMVHSVFTSIQSNTGAIIQRGLAVCRVFADEPQTFVDFFVNFDCDASGKFENIFQRLVELVVNRCYFQDDPNDPVPLYALKTLRRILEGLWDYYLQHEQQQHAQNADDLIASMQKKTLMLEGFDLFARSPFKGITYFQNKGLCGQTNEEIAQFLLSQPGLNPSAVGEILGGHKDGCAEILKSYLSLFDFRQKTFERSFREFLTSFQIPGEAQMIDRVMEAFGMKFYEDNPSIFRSPGTVYVLAFSTLMLHTDAHHPSVQNKMTLDEFINNNQGIDDKHDLPREFLTDLYNGITQHEIALMSKVPLKREQRAGAYWERCNETLQRIKDEGGLTESHFNRCEAQMIVGPMFEKVWGGILAVFTMGFEQAERKDIVDICLDGLTFSTHIASHCYVELALETLVDSFTKFTRLRTYSREIRDKNIECTNALLKCADYDMTALKGVWSIVLGEISAFDKLQKDPRFVTDMSLLESFFTRTPELGREEILEFVQAMAEVADIEVLENPPRLFTLLRMATVMVENKDRTKLDLIAMWDRLAPSLIKFGTKCTDLIEAAAVDVVRQIAKIFIGKVEAAGFDFEAKLIGPLVDIVSGSSSVQIKQLGVECGAKIVSTIPLHSGWRVINELILNASAEPAIADMGRELFKTVVYEHLDSVRKDYLLDVITTAETLKVPVGTMMTIGTVCSSDDEWMSLIKAIKQTGPEWVSSIGQVVGENETKISENVWNWLFKVEGRLMKDNERLILVAEVIGRVGLKSGAEEMVREWLQSSEDQDLQITCEVTLERFGL